MSSFRPSIESPKMLESDIKQTLELSQSLRKSNLRSESTIPYIEHFTISSKPVKIFNQGGSETQPSTGRQSQLKSIAKRIDEENNTIKLLCDKTTEALKKDRKKLLRGFKTLSKELVLRVLVGRSLNLQEREVKRQESMNRFQFDSTGILKQLSQEKERQNKASA